MTQKMTATEALADALGMRSASDRLGIELLSQTVPIEDQVADRIRALGFVLIPIEPDDAVVERMARAICAIYHSDTLSVTEFLPDARAAYAAIITAPSEK